MIYNFLTLFSLNIQSGFIADDNKSIEIFVYSFGLSVNCIFEFQRPNLWTLSIFFLRKAIYVSCFAFNYYQESQML